MLIYNSHNRMFVHENKLKSTKTEMFSEFSKIDDKISMFERKVEKKDPNADIVMVLYSISNVHFGKPIVAVNETKPEVLFVDYDFVDVQREPIYLIEKMTTISVEGHSYTKLDVYLSTDYQQTSVKWCQSGNIITDQNLIDKLEWNNIT